MTSVNALPVIAGFWYGSDLSWLETLCITSYLDRGHRFVLYTHENLQGIPAGTDVRSAADILWPPPFDVCDNDRHRVAVFSDIFRLQMIRKTGLIWVDLDAYCLQPFDFDNKRVFARDETGGVPNGVLGLPPDSATLAALLDFLQSPNPTQPWRGPRLHRQNARRVVNGEGWGIEALGWGCSGPKALTHFLRETGEDRHALAPETFYPLAISDLWKLHAPHVPTETIEGPGVHSVHIYGHQKKYIASALHGLPRVGSYLDRLCQRHSIDPAAQKVPYLDWMQRKDGK